MKNIRRVEIPALLLIIAIAGCAGLKDIPLFNNDAALKNRIASAYEFYTETNDQVTEAMKNGLITQAEVDKNYKPNRDIARGLIDEADALRVTGSNEASAGKLNAAKAILIAVREQLKSMKGGH